MWRVVVPIKTEEAGMTLLSSEVSTTTASPQPVHHQYQQQQQQQQQHPGPVAPVVHHPGWPSHHHYPAPPPPPPPPPGHHPYHPHPYHHQEQHMQEAQPRLQELPPSMRHQQPGEMAELTELKSYGSSGELRPQDQQQSQQTAQPRPSLKRPMSDSDCDDVFSEESGKEPCNSPGGDSCQHTSRKRRRGMIEKKRRDRINASLSELRRLVPAAARDPHSGKLEKAEILQLTVEHLRQLRNKGPDAYDSTKLAMDYHAVGWGECVAEVGRYLTTMEGLDERDPLRIRILSHLQSFHRDSQNHQQQQQQQQQQSQHGQQQQHQQQHQQQQHAVAAQSSQSLLGGASTYEPNGSMPIASLVPPPPLLGWSPAQYPHPAQYPQHQQHGKPYRPWGAELAY